MPWAPFGLDTPSVFRDIALSPFLWGLPWRLFDPSVMLKGSWLFVSVSRSSLLGIEAMFLRPNDIFLISLGEKKKNQCVPDADEHFEGPVCLPVSMSQAQSNPCFLLSMLPAGRERPGTWKNISPFVFRSLFHFYFC